MPKRKHTLSIQYLLNNRKVTMGCVTSLCKRRENDMQQYANLVIPNINPIVLDQIVTDDTDSTPLFPNINSDSDEPVQAPESLTDEELNLYAEKLNRKIE